MALRLNKTESAFMATMLRLMTGILSAWAITGQAVEITVQLDQVVMSHPRHPFGINLNYLRDVDSLWPEETRSIADALKDMRVRWLRYPGGEKSDHVRFSSPPYTNAAPVVYDYYRSQQKTDLLDFDEFIALCRNVGAEPWVVVPYDTASKTEKYEDFLPHAVEWVNYANRLRGYNVKYWEIGNENWHPESKNKNPQRSRDILAIAQAMKEADPSILIASSGIDPAITGDSVDTVSLSGYVGTWEASPWKETFGALQDRALFSTSWLKSSRLVEQSGRDIPLAVVEWSFKYDRKRNDLISALGALDVAGWQYTHGKNMLNHLYWTTRYMDQEHAQLVSCTLDPKNNLTATGRAAWIIGNFFTCDALACDSSDTEKVHAYAFLDKEAGKVNLLLINRNDSNEQIQVSFGTAVASVLHGTWLFSGSGPLDTQPVWQSREQEVNTLPPYSAAIFRVAFSECK